MRWRWRRAGHSSSRQRFDRGPLLGPGQHEEQVREPVGVAQYFRIAQLAGLLQANDTTLGAAHHGTSYVQGGGRRRPTRDDERIRQWNAALQVDDLELDAAGEIRGDDHEMLLQLVVLSSIGRQLGADRKKLALDAQDDRMPAAVLDEGAGRAQRRDCLIDGAIGLGARIGLGDPTAVEEAGLSPIPGLGDDALARDGDA